MSSTNEILINKNDFIYETINFIINNNNLSIMYKKVILREYINNYLNENNKNEIKNIIKNYDIKIYDYLFLNKQEKNKLIYNKYINTSKEYYKNHKDELIEKRKQYYQEHREQQLKQKKEYYQRKKQEKQQEELNSKK